MKILLILLGLCSYVAAYFLFIEAQAIPQQLFSALVAVNGSILLVGGLICDFLTRNTVAVNRASKAEVA